MKTINLSSSFILKTSFLKKTEPLHAQHSKKADWLYKRITLHIIWGVLNILGLIYISTLIKNSGLELLFLIGCFVYCSSYWLITSILFDKIIGDEIDISLK